jgi:uncharacterized membrane protein YGL010W
MGLFERQIQSYGSYHSHPKNKILHIIGTPFIIYSILGAASHVSVPINDGQIGLQWVIAGGLAIWYVIFNLIYGGLAAIWILGLASMVPWLWELPEVTRWIVLAVMQIGGWATLFSGHAIEGRKPALFDNIAHIFNAAPFVTAELIDLLKFKKTN